jgi:uncharacterized membrane protein YkvA (DUF1232 family)
MSELTEKCLETFPGWLRSLGEDVQSMLEALQTEDLEEPSRRQLAGGINYLFKSLDLIPDGIDDIGYLDDAFVLRLCTGSALRAGKSGLDGTLLERLEAMSRDEELIREYLEDAVFERLEKYTVNLEHGAARGRTVDEIVAGGDELAELAEDVKSFATDFETPAFSKDEKNLIKLKAFFDAKLPK